MELFFAYSGAIASVWIVAGIYIASLFYPGYNHKTQFCSELGAFNSPTQRLSPVINNYPLGALFIFFGIFVLSESQFTSAFVIGLMVIAHGLGTLVAGYFPMDSDPFTQNPSNSCKIHSLAGVVMLLSLLVAPAFVVFENAYPSWLRIFSLACIFGCSFFSYTLAKSFKNKSNLGVHQRLSYGFQILWLFVFSLFVASEVLS
ncbi:DUF998 domain-containing protein [Litoribrevibacter euphylliae]|uniref:DUF998 domain-containing protein n=1 Tax=Litoribrevibacter euphylliae TaxID=1834034 RepID=A0ABV7HL84_9GAMM